MIIIAGHEIVDAGDRDRYVDAHKDLVERGRVADGCIHLAITTDPVDPRRVNNAEVWESAEALDRWRAQANAPDPGIEILGGDMRRFDASDGGPLF